MKLLAKLQRKTKNGILGLKSRSRDRRVQFYIPGKNFKNIGTSTQLNKTTTRLVSYSGNRIAVAGDVYNVSRASTLSIAKVLILKLTSCFG